MARRDRGSLLLVTAMTGAGHRGAFLFAAKVHSAAIAGGNAFIQWLCLVVGTIAIVCGSLGRQWAISTLGRFFTLNVQVTDDQRVVTNGPYRWVRHPSYTADLLAFTGIGLALGNWLSLLAAASLPLLGLLVRIRSRRPRCSRAWASRTAHSPPARSACCHGSGRQTPGTRLSDNAPLVSQGVTSWACESSWPTKPS